MGCPSEETTRHWIVWVPAGSGSVMSAIASGPSTRGGSSVSSSPSSSEIRTTGLTSKTFAEDVRGICSGAGAGVGPSSGAVARRGWWAWAGGGAGASASISAATRASSTLGAARREVREGSSTEFVTPARIRQGSGRQLSAPGQLSAPAGCRLRHAGAAVGRVPSPTVAHRGGSVPEHRQRQAGGLHLGQVEIDHQDPLLVAELLAHLAERAD